jgi:hypothetical protein
LCPAGAGRLWLAEETTDAYEAILDF